MYLCSFMTSAKFEFSTFILVCIVVLNTLYNSFNLAYNMFFWRWRPRSHFVPLNISPNPTARVWDVCNLPSPVKQFLIVKPRDCHASLGSPDMPSRPPEARATWHGDMRWPRRGGAGGAGARKGRPRRNGTAEDGSPRRERVSGRSIARQHLRCRRFAQSIEDASGSYRWFSRNIGRMRALVSTWVHFMVRSGFHEYEVKKLRSPACNRQDDAIFPPHIHGTWSAT